MEDGHDEEIRSSSNCSNDLLLYCDEAPFAAEDDFSPVPPAAAIVDCDDAVDELMREYKAKERCFAPAAGGGYLRRLLHDCGGGGEGGLSSSVSSARSKAIHYILYAYGRLGLAAATAFNAANYLDRFLAINCHLSWELWMVEVVSVACLSVACKLDEVNIPPLHHLQMEEVLRHSFRASTVRDMELTLLKALQWRLACVTPYSYLQLLLLPTASPADRSLCTRLLLRCLSEPSFLRFDASVVAAAALRCTTAAAASNLTIPAPLSTQLAEECFKMMKKLALLELDSSSNSSSSSQREDQNYTAENAANHLQGTIGSTPPISVTDPFQNTTEDDDRSCSTSTVNNRSSAVIGRRRRLFGAPDIEFHEDV
ncbi:hypothetical protein BRADI_3g06910v3 [Brachypodium distachyon]|uniref:Cyclin-like domain-containing protein n=1 Tax=Brachypodium distachyon TaxID=15368 RepID=A0A2K2CVM4_BRADI|nr:hypothetical protein BRADI_3g06910v3 [Brachypodium distachyon]